MKKIFFLAIATFALMSCNNEENYVSDPVAAKVTATIGESNLTRVSDSEWAAGDEIGISSIVGSVAGPYTNVKYTTGGNGKFTGTALYFYSPMTLIAYYPFTGDETTPPGIDGVIEANTRADNQDQKKQPKINFLWDSKTSVDKKDFSAAHPNVDFVFAHKMSKVSFIFQDSKPVFHEETGLKIADGVDVSNMVSYKINNLVLEGTFNTNTGVCAVKAGAPTEPLSINVNNVKHNTAVFPVILFPQTLSGGSAMLDVYTDELNSQENLQHYKCNLSFSNGEIKPGYHYIYTIQVTKIGLIVGQMTVEPWKEEDRFMTATIDGGNVFN